MKIRYYILFAFVFLFTIPGISQDGRTFETKVADALNVLPANNEKQYTKTIQDLINLGTDVVPELARLYEESSGEEIAKLEYAFSGIGKYLSSTSESVRNQFSDAFVAAALENKYSPLATDLLEELTYFMPAGKLATLKPLLEVTDLQMRVLDILEMHPDKESGELIWSVMGQADNRSRFKIYKILADERFEKTSQVLNPRMADSKSDLGQLVLKGMAASGDARFAEYFSDLADENADLIETDAIILYGDVRYKKGEGKAAFDYLKNIYEDESVPSTLRALAISKMAEVDPALSVSALRQAFGSEDARIAAAAAHGLVYLNADQYKALSSAIDGSFPIAKADAIRILTRSGWSGSTSIARSNLSNADSLVRAQAVIGLAEMEGSKAQKEVLEFLKKNDQESVILAGLQAVKMTTDRKNIKAVANMLDQFNDDKKALLIPVLAARGDQSYFEQMLGISRSSDGVVQKQAIEALAKLGADKNIGEVLSFLAEQSGDNVAVTQGTLDQLMRNSESQNWEPELLKAIEGSEKSKFIPLIGHLSGDKPQQLANTILSGTDNKIKNQLLTNMGEWDNGQMIQSILPLLKNEETYRNAFSAAMGTINRADWPEERKVLYLHQLFDLTDYPKDKQDVIQKIGEYRNFYSMITLGEYLEKTTGSVQNNVARAITNVVMPGPQNDDGMTDPMAVDLLQKAGEIVTGSEAVYLKENINTYIESVTADDQPEFVPMFNGKNLDGWHGFVANPIQLGRMSEKEIQEKLEASNNRMREHWWVEDGLIRFKGDGQNIVTDKDYRNFVMLIDYKIGDKGDSGVYLRGTPQVQIWDVSRTDVGAEVGSGGLYNNEKHPSKPLKVADMPIGDWNHMKIVMMGDKVTVWLNGDLVVDNVVLENYWDRSMPIFPGGPIELQAHGTDIAFKNLYVKEIPSGEDLLTEEEKKEGFVPLFNGYNLDGWTGNKTQYSAENGMIVVDPGASGSHGNLFTDKEYDNFNIRLEFLLTPGANNGLGIHAPLTGDAAYGGKELQILDNSASIYANLKPYQYHGSLYGVAAAERGHLKPVGEWNSQEVIIDGDRYKVILNGATIMDISVKEVTKDGTMDGKDHPGLKRTKGHLGFLGHGSEVKFRNIRLKELK